jgi:hypothetical protein
MPPQPHAAVEYACTRRSALDFLPVAIANKPAPRDAAFDIVLAFEFRHLANPYMSSGPQTPPDR